MARGAAFALCVLACAPAAWSQVAPAPPSAPVPASVAAPQPRPPAFLPAPQVPGPGPFRFDADEAAAGRAPLSLGRALANVEARPEGLDLSLVPPPPPANLGARTLVMSGVILVAVGIAGMFVSPHCDVRRPEGGCLVAQGTDPLFPALLVLGLGVTTTGAYWMRRDLPSAD